MSGYHDRREGFFREWFSRGIPYLEYIHSGTPQDEKKWSEMESRIQLSPSQKMRVEAWKREMPVLVLSGIWCGDCVRQGPMFHAIEQANARVQFRFIESKPNPDLQEELRICGAERVPVVVAFSEEFYEVGRFGDRHLSVYQRKAERELGPACDPGILPPDPENLSQELDEWINWLERNQLLLRLAPALRKRYGD
jgi:thiol-disulfide isomerase/thioredoxin